MKKFRNFMLIALVLVVAVAGHGEVKAAGPVQLKIATLGVGSSWYIYGATFAELLGKAVPKGSKIDVLPYSGSIGNPKLVSKGEADLGLGMGIVAGWAYEGKYKFDKKYPKLRAIVGALDQYYYAVIAREDLGINSLADIKAKKMAVKIVTQPTGSLNAVMSYMVFGAYGITKEDIEKYGGRITHTSNDVIASDMKDGRANIWFQPATAGHPNISSVAVTTKLKFLPYDPAVVKELGEKYGFAPATMPAGAFKGQDEDVSMVGFKTSLFASEDMSEDLAYLVTKTLCENADKLHSAHKGMKSFDPSKAWEKQFTGLPLHPGAEKYYKEKGYMK